MGSDCPLPWQAMLRYDELQWLHREENVRGGGTVLRD